MTHRHIVVEWREKRSKNIYFLFLEQNVVVCVQYKMNLACVCVCVRVCECVSDFSMSDTDVNASLCLKHPHIIWIKLEELWTWAELNVTHRGTWTMNRWAVNSGTINIHIWLYQSRHWNAEKSFINKWRTNVGCLPQDLRTCHYFDSSPYKSSQKYLKRKR